MTRSRTSSGSCADPDERRPAARPAPDPRRPSAGEYDPALAAQLIDERRAVVVRIAGEERLIAAEDAGRYATRSVRCRRQAFRTLSSRGPDSLRELVIRFAKGRGRSRRTTRAERFGRDVGGILVELERDELLVRGELGPAAPSESGAIPTCCAASGVRRSPRFVARWSPSNRRRWLGLLLRGTGSARALRFAKRSFPCRLCRCPWRLGSEVLPRRVRGFRPEHLDALTASGEVVWVGAGQDRVALYFREDASALGRVPAAPAPESPEHDALREALRGALFGTSCSPRRLSRRRRAAGALGSRVVGRGDERRVDAAARVTAVRRAEAGAPSAPVLPPPRPRPDRDRRTLVAHRPPVPGSPDRRALAELLLERQGIVTRDGVRAEGIPGGYGAVYAELRALETLGLCRRGYFVEGLGGAQFALGGAVERFAICASGQRRPNARPRRRRPRAAVRRRAAVAEASRRSCSARRRGVRRPARG